MKSKDEKEKPKKEGKEQVGNSGNSGLRDGSVDRPSDPKKSRRSISVSLRPGKLGYVGDGL